MELIIFQPGISTATNAGYKNSVKMAYLINAVVACAGIKEQDYLMPEVMHLYTFDQKMTTMSSQAMPGISAVQMYDMIQEIKYYMTLKNKSSKEIVAFTLLKNKVSKLYDQHVLDIYDTYEKWFGLKTMKFLLDVDHFFFYYLDKSDSIFQDPIINPPVDFMRLRFEIPSDQWSIFFMNFDSNEGWLFADEICDPGSKMAEDRSNFYGIQSFIFPCMDGLSTNEIAEARRQLLVPTGEFRIKIDQWACICYENPDTNQGLTYFRDELLEFLPSMQDKAQESWIIKNAGVASRQPKQSQIIIGEAPIEKIWEYYRDSHAISIELYEQLIQLQKQEFPLLQGRWPVFIYKSAPQKSDDLSDEIHGGDIKSVRKTISVD